MFTDEEALPWVKKKIQKTTDLKVETNSDLYGAMHILCNDRHGMETYVKAYKCEEKQGLIANLSRELQKAVDILDSLNINTDEAKFHLNRVDEILGLK